MTQTLKTTNRRLLPELYLGSYSWFVGYSDIGDNEASNKGSRRLGLTDRPIPTRAWLPDAETQKGEGGLLPTAL